MKRHVCQLLNVKRSKVKVTRSRDVSADINAVTRQWMVISASNLVEIIDVGVDACIIISRSVGQKTGSRNMADNQNIKCKIYVKQRRIAEILHPNRKSGSANRTALSKFTPEVHK